jgi:hypothetical protein
MLPVGTSHFPITGGQQSCKNRIARLRWSEVPTKTDPEQNTRSGSYKSLPQLVRSPGGVGVSGDGNAARIERIKSEVSSETSAHNAAMASVYVTASLCGCDRVTDDALLRFLVSEAGATTL